MWKSLKMQFTPQPLGTDTKSESILIDLYVKMVNLYEEIHVYSLFLCLP